MALTLNGENGIVYANLNNDIKNLLMPKNWIINGMFDVWQRGTTQTTNGYGSDDRWSNEHFISTKTHSRQAFTLGQTDVPNNPTYFSRTIVISGGGVTSATTKSHRIEDITKFSGKTIVISFWAKADANKNIAIEFRQNFGSGGSTVVTSIGVQKFALTTVWQKFTKIVTLPSISGKTVGLNNYLDIIFWFDAGSNYNAQTDSLGNQSGTFDIANVSLVEGSVAVECQNQPYADVLRECMRYYQRFGDSSLYAVIGFGYAENTTTGKIMLNFIVPFRSADLTITYSGLHWISNTSGATISSISVDTSSKNRLNALILLTTTGLTGGVPIMLRQNNDVSGHLSLSAEL